MKLLLLLHSFGLLSFVHSIIEVIGELNGVVILPCSFPPGKDEVIHWTIAGNEQQRVHIYYEGKDMIEEQDKRYTGRTSVFLDQIRNGNASLQLRNLQKRDENKYSCYVSTKEYSREVVILLKVEAAVWGEQHKSVIIPCSFNPGEEVVIHWRIATNESRLVHSYYQGKDRLDKQDKSYKGRTSLILNELEKGNASLQLQNLQEGDKNTYSCYVGTQKENKEDIVKLNIADFGHSIEYVVDHNKLHLKCYASHSYPSDTVTIKWYEDNREVQSDINTSSSCTSCHLKNNLYKCIIKHSLVQNTWTGIWQVGNATKQNNVECACRSCKTVSPEMLFRLYLRTNKTEVPVASIISSSYVPAAGYGSRVQRGEYSLHLHNLTANDSGEYVCEIRTSDAMYITMTSVNITHLKENYNRHHWITIVSVTLAILLSFVCSLMCKKQSHANQGHRQ